MSVALPAKRVLPGQMIQFPKIELPKGQISPSEQAVYRFAIDLRQSATKPHGKQAIAQAFQALKKSDEPQAKRLTALVWEEAGKPKKDKFGTRALQGDPHCLVSALVIDQAARRLLQELAKGRLKTADKSEDPQVVKELNVLRLLRMSLATKDTIKTAYKKLKQHHPELAKQLTTLVWEEAGKPKKGKFGELALEGDPKCPIAPSLISHAVDRLAKQLMLKGRVTSYLMLPNLDKIKGLIPVLQKPIEKCTETPLSEKEIRKVLHVAAAYFPQKEVMKINRKKEQLTRTVLIGPEAPVLLMTRCRKKGDKLLGSGAFKQAKYAISFNGQLKVVDTCRKGKATPSNLRDLKNEIEMMRRFKGVAGVIQLDFAVVTKDKCYIVMECCNGGDLHDAIASKDKELSQPDRLQIATDIAEGLKNIHAQGVLHRDLKPGNIFLIKEEGQIVRARIADLGLARKMSDQRNLTGPSGTAYWEPPERANAEVCSASKKEKEKLWHQSSTDKADIWTMGAIFFKLFNPAKTSLSCQRELYSDEPVVEVERRIASVTDEQLSDEVEQSGIDPNLAALILDMLKVDPKKRISMEQVYARIKEIRSEFLGVMRVMSLSDESLCGIS